MRGTYRNIGRTSAAWLRLLLGIALAAAHAPLAGGEAPPPPEGQAHADKTQPALAELAPANLKLQVAEKLVYDIRVGGIPAGKAALEVTRTGPMDGDTGPPIWAVMLTVRANRAMSFFYDVRNQTRSWIDVKAGFSRFYRNTRREGDVRVEERIRISYDIGKMEASYERPGHDDQWRSHAIPLTGKALDPLSAVYYLRSVPLANLNQGDEIVLPVCADRRVWNTKLSVVEPSHQEDIGYLKRRGCVVVEVDAEFQGLFQRKGKMRVWLDVATGIPLRMRVELPIGPAEVTLSEARESPLPEK
jgi:hypothetical protein